MSSQDEVLLLEPRDIVPRLKRWRWWIAVLACSAAVAVFVVAKIGGLPSPSYTSSTEIKIIPTGAELSYARSALGGSRDSQSTALVRTFIETMKSDAVVNSAIAQLPTGDDDGSSVGQPNPYGQKLKSLINSTKQAIEYLNYGDVIEETPDPTKVYRDAITIQSITGSFVIRLNVTLDDPETSVALAVSLVSALQTVVAEKNARAKEQIRDNYTQRIESLEDDLNVLIAEELHIREEIGALDLEARLQLLTDTLTEQTSKLVTLRFQYDQFSDQQGGPSERPLKHKIDVLEAQIAELTQLRGNLLKKDFKLRSNRFQQENLAEAIALGRQVFSSPELGEEYGTVEIDIIRAPRKAIRPDPPTPLALAVSAAIGVVVVSYMLLIFLSAREALTRERETRKSTSMRVPFKRK